MHYNNQGDLMRISTAILALAMSLFFVSCKTPTGPVQIPGVKGPNIEIVDQSMVISLDFETISFEFGGTFDIPKITGSTVGVNPSLDTGGTLLQISLDMNQITNGNIILEDAASLPGGRPLPGIREGKLPSVAMTVPKFKDMTFYLSKKVFGIFIPFKVGINDIITYRLVVKERFIGTISLVGQDENGQNSGALMLINLTRSNKALLQKLIQNQQILNNLQ